MGLDAGENPQYQISAEDSRLIKAYQVCKAFHCLNLNIYRNNPTWWNSLCYALLATELKAESDKLEEIQQKNG